VVAFSSPRQGDGVYRLYMGDSPVGTSTTEHTLGDYPVFLPTWELVFSGCDYGWGSGSNCGLWRTSSGGTPSQITGVPRDIPLDGTGQEVLFLRQEDDNWDIYRIALDGGNLTRLTEHPGRDGPAAFSPDGRTIAFLSERSGTWALYTMNRQGQEVEKRLDLPLGGSFDAAPLPWTSERLSWGAEPTSSPAPTAVSSGLLPAPQITFPIMDDTVSASKSTTVHWTWTREISAGQGYQVRFWHTSESSPMGVAPPVSGRQLEVHFGLTDAYRNHGEGLYHLDVVVVQEEPFQVLSESAPLRVKAILGK
jgi:hypothetical protein